MNTLFLIVMVPLFKKNGKTYLEAQSLNGITKWAENFDAVTVLFPETLSKENYPSIEWVSAEKINCDKKINIISLPLNYNTPSFIIDVIKYKNILKKQIREHKFSVFSIGGLAGDWGAVAALFSINKNHKYAVWTDRVEHLVVKREAEKKKGLKKLYNKFVVPFLMKKYHGYIIKKASIGLFHGNDCLNIYSPIQPNSFLVHNVHYKKGDQIENAALENKIKNVMSGGTLNISYSGRISEMKGPIEWLNILKGLKGNGIPFIAKWFGEGDLKEEMIEKIKEYDLENNVHLMGFVSDKDTVKLALQESDIFLFCHKTPESPRNLIEALKSAAPIIGFYSNYSKDLINKYGGGKLVDNFDCNKIVEFISKLHNDRNLLASYVKKANSDGKLYDDDIVFEHRSTIIKNNLS